MRGIDIFQNPYYREISTMRGRTMRVLPVELEAWLAETLGMAKSGSTLSRQLS